MSLSYAEQFGIIIGVLLLIPIVIVSYLAISTTIELNDRCYQLTSTKMRDFTSYCNLNGNSYCVTCKNNETFTWDRIIIKSNCYVDRYNYTRCDEKERIVLNKIVGD